jgi:hypothetical protein
MGTQWPAYRQLLNFPGIPQDTQPGWEVIDIDASVAQLAAAPPLRTGMPLVVLSKTEPFPVPAGEKAFSPARLQKAWNQTQDELPALEPGARPSKRSSTTSTAGSPRPHNEGLPKPQPPLAAARTQRR